MSSKRNFNEWLSTFRKSINGYGYYTDFEKVYENAEKLKIEINILNSLVGSKTIREDFSSVLNQYPNCLKAVPLLLAVRSNEIYCQDANGEINYRFDVPAQTTDQYAYFMEKTGLFDLMSNHIICNLFDYVTGVEVGLGSNGRKNRGGHQMEELVEYYIKRTGKEYHKEMYLTDVQSRWGVDLSPISADGTSEKRFDFVVRNGKGKLFLMETNFYAASGSKLNETARSYKMIAQEAKGIAGVRFVWITDGGGWMESAKGNLEETFNVLEDLYNIKDLKDGILDKLLN